MPGVRPIPDAAVDIVAKWEGFEAKAYKCPAGVWTIGYGHTGGVKAGQVITEEDARALLRADLETAAQRLAIVIRDRVDQLTDNQYAALLSFVYNLGANQTWTIWRKINAGEFDAVPDQMRKFVFAGKKKLQGLVNRRADEVALWQKA